MPVEIETFEALSPLAAMVPMGVSPFLALGLFGVAADTIGLTLPPALTVLSHPVIWGALLALALLLKGGRSFKLTKPMAEIAGTTESLVAFVAFAMMFITPEATGMAEPPAPDVATASVLGTALLTVAALTGLLAVTLVRMGIDLLTWLSPIPLVDALLQLGKLAVTAALVAVAVFLPGLAVVVNLALLVATALVMRWLYRLSRFIGVVVRDRMIGGLRPWSVAEDAGRVGPVTLWALGTGSGFPRFSAVVVEWTAEAGWTARPLDGRTTIIGLGPSPEATLDRGFLGTTLVTPQGGFLFTARYADAVRGVSARTGTPLVGRRAEPGLEMQTI